MSSSGSANNTAPVTQRAKRAYRNQLKQLQTAEYEQSSGGGTRSVAGPDYPIPAGWPLAQGAPPSEKPLDRPERAAALPLNDDPWQD